MANFEIVRPKVTQLLPKWSLEIVLDFLKSPTFVPYQSALLADSTKKTVFLIGLASAYRVSELHALSAHRHCCRFDQDGTVTLLPFPGFVAKNKRPGVTTKPLRLTPLLSNVEWCPVTALHRYLEVTEGCRAGRMQLFLPLKTSTQKTTPQLLSCWVRRLIQDAYTWTVAGRGISDTETLSRTSPLPSRLGPDAGAQRFPFPASLLTSRHCHAVGHTLASADQEPPLPGKSDRLGGSKRCSVDLIATAPPSSSRSPPCNAPDRELDVESTADLDSQESGPSRGWGDDRARQHPIPSLHRPVHELRAIAASFSLARGTALEDIVKAVGWGSSSAFAAAYFRHVSSLHADVEIQDVSLPGATVQRL
eukprot:TRINITY_DN25299_c0_g1_i2.p1 TRINITY_DN25299_c0_g1~~TRINITY_DN25299_c0_g1_i2.p1  ORF type:complete len:407 (+),score=9.35 TRINITY_DN25299_c0_g1_i2:130-1221(+)